MKAIPQRLTTLLVLCLVSVQMHAQELAVFYGSMSNDWYKLTFKLPTSLSVNEPATGFYSYDNIGIDIPLTALVTNGQLKLTARPDDGSAEELFKADIVIEGDRIEIPPLVSGTWQKGGGNILEFFFTPHNFRDRDISCKEMKQIPSIVFKGSVDLGSGAGSPTSVDYDCPEALANKPVVERLVKLAYEMRGTTVTRCSGSIRHLHSRAIRWRLLETSFSPLTLEKSSRWRERVKDYLETDWSRQGIYNQQLYREFLKEAEDVRPSIADYYASTFNVNREQANAYADLFIDQVKTVGAGNLVYSWSAAKEQNPLLSAVVAQRGVEVVKPLVAQGGLDEAIQHASYDVEVLKVLLDAGANIDAENWFGKTSLYYAIQFNNYESVQYLLQQGADVNHQYFDQEELYGYTSMPCISIYGTLRTPLMHAAQHASLPVVKLLLESGADLSAKDERGWGVIEYSKDNEFVDVAPYLLDRYNALPEETKNPPVLVGDELEQWRDEIFGKASIARNAGNFKAARKFLRTLVRKDIADADVLLGVAETALALGRDWEALKYAAWTSKYEGLTQDQLVRKAKAIHSACRMIEDKTGKQKIAIPGQIHFVSEILLPKEFNGLFVRCFQA